MAEFRDWSSFLARFRWYQGEHVTLVGPTGSGKTTLARAILPKRRTVLVLAAKPRDPLIGELKRDGYHVMKRWSQPIYEATPKVIYWPKINDPADVIGQREGFMQALADCYRRGGVCVYIDELQYVMDREFLGMAPLGKLLWQQGRSLGVSVVGGTQRPAHIPLAAYSQATHLFFWNSNDAADTKRLREIGGRVDPKRLEQSIRSLDGHSVLYVNTRTGELIETLVSASD